MAEPRRRPKDRKAQIASVAAEAFSEQGYHAVSMDDIAHRVGVSAAALYRHSPSKYDLFRTAVLALSQQLVDATALPGEPAATEDEAAQTYDRLISALEERGLDVATAADAIEAMEIVQSRKFDLAVISHAEDANLKGKGVMNEGFNSARFGLRGIPRTSEDLIVARDILLAELTGARIHVAHLSTVGAVELVRQAKKRGVRVTAEVTPHHLNLTDDAVANYDTNTKVAPPLREQRDVDAVREALADGTIDIVASDHAPHSIDDKLVEYDLAEFGMVGLETAFPLYYRMCLRNGVALSRLVASMTTEPAKVLGIPKGTLKVGADADVSIFDPEKTYRIDKMGFRSKSRNTPFHGWEVQGKVRYTIVAGRVVYNSEAKKETL